MTAQEAMMYARILLIQFGLAERGWTFRINNNRSRLGVCRFRNRTVEISRYHLASPAAAIRNTLLHEIAHALVGPSHGHGPVWRAKALEIGCDGKRCGTMEAPARYIGTCPKCNVTIKRNRLSERLHQAVHVGCGASRVSGEYIRWVRNG
jgi:hypothetical protein